nr:PaaI family thioesterase [Desulfopila inferna]
MCFESNGRQIRSKLLVKKTFRGWSNLIHGGILSTMLDETMSWAVIKFTGKFMLTRSMTVTFKKPVHVGSALTAIGYVKKQSSERKAEVVAEIRDEDGDICAVSEGDFALFSKKHFLRMGIMPEEDIEAMASAISD